MLAGVSADYSLRLERGRDTHPAPQVLDALARVLLLDEVERRHLHGPAEPVSGRREPERRTPALLGAPATAPPANETEGYSDHR